MPVIHETVEAGESQLRQEAATPERTPQTLEDPPSPGMELSFAQQVADPPTPVHERPADPSTPILEIPEDPTTPALTLNTTPLAHLSFSFQMRRGDGLLLLQGCQCYISMMRSRIEMNDRI